MNACTLSNAGPQVQVLPKSGRLSERSQTSPLPNDQASKNTRFDDMHAVQKRFKVKGKTETVLSCSVVCHEGSPHDGLRRHWRLFGREDELVRIICGERALHEAVGPEPLPNRVQTHRELTRNGEARSCSKRRRRRRRRRRRHRRPHHRPRNNSCKYPR